MSDLKILTVSNSNNQRFFVAASSLLIAIYCCFISCSAPAQTRPTNNSTIFATDPNSGTNAASVPGAAAMVDDHVIQMDEVSLICLRKYRSYVIDQMVQNYVVNRECKKRGLSVDESQIDEQINALRKTLAPATLEDTIKKHQSSIADVREKFRQDILRKKLAAEQVKPVRMIHCEEILLKPGSGNGSTETANSSEADIAARLKSIQDKLAQGTAFDSLVSDSKSKGLLEKKDLGVLYENMLGMDASILGAAMELHKGEVSPPVQTSDGYHFLKIVSTMDDHPRNEDSLYQAATKESGRLQIQFLEPKVVVELIDHSQLTFIDDSELIPGKAIPDAAAVIDGYKLPMSEVAEKCLASFGPKTVDILVQNYVVDQECARRGISVGNAEVDVRVEELRKQIAPNSFAEGLTAHHTTEAGLRRDFKQQIERTKLVMDQVKPAKLVHARVIQVRSSASAGPTRMDTEAKALAAKIHDELAAGKTFEDVAKLHSELKDAGGDQDLGVLYRGKQGIDTAMLNAGLSMEAIGISPQIGRTQEGYFILQVVSTGDQHAGEEAAAYAKALKVYRQQAAQPLIPDAIVGLLKQHKIIYFLHT